MLTQYSAKQMLRVQIVPGKPLDWTVLLRALEPSAPNELALKLMVKTQQRKC